MVAALAVLAVLAVLAGAEPLGRAGVSAVNDKDPLGIDLNKLLASLLAPYDPFHVPERSFDVDLAEMSAKGIAKNTVVTGISGLRLLHLSLSELGDGKAAVSLHLPAINVVGDYDVKGAIKQPLRLPLDSDGQFTFGFTDLEVSASVQLGISDVGQILLKDFQLQNWNLTEIELNLGGLLSGHPLGNMINDILKDTLTHIVTKAYHEKLTALVVKTVIAEGGKYLASLHRDLHRDIPTEAPVVPRPLRDSSSLLSSQTSDKRTARTDSLSLAGVDSEELGVSGLFTLDLAAPRFYPHGALLSAHSDGPEDSPSDIRESAVNKLLGAHLAPAQFYPHGELSSGSESLAADNSGVQIQEGLQGLLSGHGVKFEPVGETLFYEKGHLSRRNQDDGTPIGTDSL